MLDISKVKKAQEAMPANTDAVKEIRNRNESKRKDNAKNSENNKTRARKSGGIRTNRAEVTKKSMSDEEVIPARKGDEMPEFDANTREGRRQRLMWMVNNAVDTQARQAITDLNKMDAEDGDHDPNAKVDPAEICAYLARADLYGKDPVKVMMETNGARRVLSALLNKLSAGNVTYILAQVGDDLVDVGAKPQCLEGFSTDGISVGDDSVQP